jgi:DNA-binding NarL/FixJ family response regulator
MKPVKIIIAHSQPDFAKKLALSLYSSSKLSLPSVTSSPPGLLQRLGEEAYAVLILDAYLSEIDCMELTKIVKQTHPNVHILLLADTLKTSLLMDAFQAGISGYLQRSCSTEDIKEAIFTLARGENYLDDHFANELARQYRTFFNKLSAARMQMEAVFLSDREKQVLTLIAEEYSNSEIAEKLCISPSTVETHRKNLIRKLGVRNSLGLVKHAFRNGLIDLN